MNPITARYRWTVVDLLTGRKISLRLNRALLYFRLALGSTLLAFAFWQYQTGSFSWVFYLALGIILPITIGVRKTIQTRLLRRQFNKRPDANAGVEWIISDQGIVFSTPLSKGEIQWSAFQKIVATPKGFLFMPNRQIFHFIPVRAFETPADVENLNTLARQHAKEFKELE
jgi:hypothetical protein